MIRGKVDFIHAAGGTAVGPDNGDQGDWQAAMANPPAPNASAGTNSTSYTLYESCTAVTTQEVDL